MNHCIIYFSLPLISTAEVRNRFKGLDLIDRVPDKLWNDVRDIVQETGIKTIPMEKKCKKVKWLFGEALQIAVKRREAKSDIFAFCAFCLVILHFKWPQA